MTTVEETPTSQPRDYSNKPPQRQRRKSRRRGGGDGGNKTSQWDTTLNLPEIDEAIASINISELQSLPRNTLINFNFSSVMISAFLADLAARDPCFMTIKSMCAHAPNGSVVASSE